MKGIVIGRNSSCDVQLDDDTVSRRHAVLSPAERGRLRLQDLGSANGTFIRDAEGWHRVSDALVRRSDRLRFGRREAQVSELLDQLGGLALVGFGGAASPKAGLSGAFELRAAGNRESLDEPRRNPDTGEIEEKGG